MSIISADKLYKTIKTDNGKLQILKNINFSMQENEYVSIMGPSGSGKSTLLGIMACIDKASTGLLTIMGRDVRGMDKNEITEFRNENIGIIFQSFNLIPVLTAEENIEMPLFFSKKNIDGKARVKELLQMVGLIDKRKSLPKQLSGGEQQRIAIARALVCEPKILLADEPTGALDSKNSTLVLDILDKFREKYNMGIVMITHDRKVAERADRMLYLEDGFLREGGI